MAESSASTQALARVQDMAAVVKAYAEKYGEAAPEGKLLSAIKEDLVQAAGALSEKELEEEESKGGLEATARSNASAALMLVAAAVDKAAAFDGEYGVTKSLAAALQGAYTTTLGLLAKMQLGGADVTGTPEESKSQLTRASEALTEALEAARSLPALGAAAALLAQARDEVNATLADMEEAPLTEKPVVAALKALALAKRALGGASAIVGDAASAVLEASPLPGALAGAAATVATARTQLFALLDAVTARAGGMLASVEQYGLATALAVDARFGVVDKAAALDAAYGVSTLAAAGVAQGASTAAALDARFGVTATASAAVDGLKGLDASVTGGAVAPLVSAGVHMAVEGAQSAAAYASGVGQKFVAAREDAAQPVAQ